MRGKKKSIPYVLRRFKRIDRAPSLFIRCPSYSIARRRDYRRERYMVAPWEESSVLACFRGNRKQAPQNFIGDHCCVTGRWVTPFTIRTWIYRGLSLPRSSQSIFYSTPSSLLELSSQARTFMFSYRGLD